VKVKMDSKENVKEDGNESQGAQARKENGHIGGVQANRTESVFPVKKPGFYKNPNKNSTGLLESASTGPNGNSDGSKIPKHHKENKAADKGPANANDETVSSSGIECGVSEKTESNFDSTSVGSGSNTHHRHEAQERVINLCMRGEWIVLDQHLRNIRRAHPSLMKADPVSVIKIISKSDFVLLFQVNIPFGNTNQNSYSMIRDDHTDLLLLLKFSKTHIVY
jgi:hypothetical protein